MQKWAILFLLFFLGCPSDFALSMDINGELKRAMAERLAGDPAGTEARFYFNTGSNTFKFYDGGSWVTVLDTNAVLATPVGTVVDFAGSTAPAGWLFLDGTAVSRATYSALFTLIGTTYGVGDGSTTFNLPDAQGRVIAGKDDMSGASQNRLTVAGSNINGDVLGTSGGLETLMQHLHAAGTYVTSISSVTVPTSTHTHNSAAHNHQFMDASTGTWLSDGVTTTAFSVYNTDNTGSNTVVRATQTGGRYTQDSSVIATNGPSVTTASITGSNTVTGSSANTGTGTTHGTVQPTLVLNKIIKY